MKDDDVELDLIPYFSKDIIIASVIVFIGTFVILTWVMQ